MKLTEVWLPPRVDEGMEVLRRMKSLKLIDGKRASEYWKKYDKEKAGK